MEAGMQQKWKSGVRKIEWVDLEQGCEKNPTHD